MNRLIKIVRQKVIVITMILAAFSCLPLSASAQNNPYSLGDFPVTNGEQAYLLIDDGSDLSIKRFSWVPNARAYEVDSIQNNQIIFRVLYSNETRWLTRFGHTRIMDIDTMMYRPVPLDDYQAWIELMDNGNLLRKTPAGIFEMFDQKSFQKINLQFDYGPVLDPETVRVSWSSYDSAFPDRPTLHTYVGVHLSYSKYNNMYVLLYGLSPYYGEITENYRGRELQSLHVALFNQDGNIIKRFPLPKEYFYNVGNNILIYRNFTSPIGYPSGFPELSYDLGGVNGIPIRFSESKPMQFLLDVNCPPVLNLVTGDRGKNITVLVDLESEKTSVPTLEYVKENFKYIDYSAVESSEERFNPEYRLRREVVYPTPFILDNKDTYTDIRSSEDNTLLRRVGKDYSIVFETVDSNDIYYAVIAHDYDYSEADWDLPNGEFALKEEFM